MAMHPDKKTEIKEILKKSISDKISNYKPETSYMPFHHRLLGRDRMALFSFIHSLNTTFGTSIYEPVAIALAKGKFRSVVSQLKPLNQISSDAQVVIQKIIDDISTTRRAPDKAKELEEIRSVCQSGTLNTVKLTRVDIWLESFQDELYFIDMKTVKPNIGDFKGYKRTLLEWAAVTMTAKPDAKVHSLIAMPYNPYEPNPYDRWTMTGIFDIQEELLIAEELWNFLGGDGTYSDLLDCFEMAGIELRSFIDEHFERFNSR